MPSYGFRQRILETFEDGAALANDTTPTNILPASAQGLLLPAGFGKIPRALAFMFSGRISNAGSAETLTLALRLGSVDVFSSGAMPLNATAKSNVHWTLSGELIWRDVGVSTSTILFPKGCRFESHVVVGSPLPSAGGAGVHLLPYNSAPAVGSGYDDTSSQQLKLMATWSAASASNSIQLHAGHCDIFV
jgi:hypothetical protein